MHETIQEHIIQGAPLNNGMVAASGESVGTLGATPGPFSFQTSGQLSTVSTRPFQITPSSMSPITGVDFWERKYEPGETKRNRQQACAQA